MGARRMGGGIFCDQPGPWQEGPTGASVWQGRCMQRLGWKEKTGLSVRLQPLPRSGPPFGLDLFYILSLTSFEVGTHSLEGRREEKGRERKTGWREGGEGRRGRRKLNL